MSEEFKTIETQDALDAIIKERLERNTRSVTDSVTKKYEGYISPDEYKKSTDSIEELNKQLEENKQAIADLTAKNAKYESDSVKMKVAREAGLPIEMADRICGKDEAEMKADAAKLASFMKPAHSPQLRDPESGEGLSGVEAAFYKRNPNLKK